MSRKVKHTNCLAKGRRRHGQLRRFFRTVKLFKDMDKGCTKDLHDYLQSKLPNLLSEQKIIVKAEVTIQNRRPDFVIFIPNRAMILLEYKTTESSLDIRSSYLSQTKDTMRKFQICQTESTSDLRATIPLLSILLIRNPTKRRNRIVCVKESSIENKHYYL